MDLGLTDKTVIVTGASSGIGLAAARQLLGEGAKVALCARGAERLVAVAEDLAAEFGAERILAQPVDVLNEAAVNGFAEAVAARFGGAVALINNAGQGRVTKRGAMSWS